MKKVDYSKVVFDVVSAFNAVNNSVAFDKETDEGGTTNVFVKSCAYDKSIAYILKCPEELFNFGGDSCSFYDFKSFYSLFGLLNEPEIEEDDENVNITLKQGEQSIKFRLTDREMIKKEFNAVELEDADASFELDDGMIKYFRQVIGNPAIAADRVSFKFTKDLLTYKIYNQKGSNTFTGTIETETSGEENFEVVIPAETILKVPVASYKAKAYENGVLNLNMVREDDIVVNVYVSSMDEETEE